MAFTRGQTNFGDPNQGDFSSIGSNGVQLFGDAPQWDDLRVPMTAVKGAGLTEPDWDKFIDDGNSTGVFGYFFDEAAEEELFFSVQFPHDWVQGTDVHVHVHWSPSADGTAGEKVCWGLEYTWANIGDDFPASTIVYGDTAALGDITSTYSHMLTEIADLSGTGKTLSSMMMCRVFRDATGSGGTDDYGADAVLLELDFHYQRDGFGSQEEYVKADTWEEL